MNHTIIGNETPDKIKKVGFQTYDLQPFTVDCLARIAARLPARMKAYPVFKRVDAPPPFPYYPSTLQGRFFAVRKPGVTPEGLTSSINWRGSWACVWESDVVVLFGLHGGSALLATALAMILRRPLVSVNQTLPPLWEAQRSWWILALKRWMLRRCQVHVVQTLVTIQALEQVYGIPKEALFFSPFEGGVRYFMGLLEKVTLSRKELRDARGWAEGEVVFLFVGTLLIRFKGIDTLIEATSILKGAGHTKFRVVCIGPVASQPGELDLEGYQNEAKKWGIEKHIFFPGACSLDDLAGAYLAGDACLLPSRKDTWGKVLAEAALARLPLVTSEACGSAHSLVLDGQTGFVVPTSDAKALAGAMEKLLDEKLRKQLGENARTVCIEWSDPDKEVDGYLQALEQVG